MLTTGATCTLRQWESFYVQVLMLSCPGRILTDFSSSFFNGCITFFKFDQQLFMIALLFLVFI